MSRAKEINCEICGFSARVSWKDNEISVTHCPACGFQLERYDVKDSHPDDWKFYQEHIHHKPVQNFIARRLQNKFNIYIGYDSNHKDLEDLCQFAIEKRCEEENIPVPKFNILDYRDIPEYVRDYAQQSTEFTYSRFMIPYLENYEGYSIFIDNDILFTEGNIYKFFMHLNLDDAVACVQYPDFDASDLKFNQQKNVSYNKKLWSSLMVFNNSHPDCRKLTPWVVNTETGKYLHQFEWTDKISNIPDRYILTDGYDSYLDKPDKVAVHYTRGGPWIEGQLMRGMNLSLYEKLYEDYKKAGRWLYNPKK